MKTFPLLQSQMGVVLACSKRPHSTCYNLPCAIPYPREIDAGRLVAAIHVVIDAHPVLKTRFMRDGQGTVRQFVDEGMTISVPVRNLAEDEAEQYLRDGFVRPFNLFGDNPLCRFEVLVTEQHCWLLCDIHHAIADGITIAHHILGRDLPSASLGEELDVGNMREEHNGDTLGGIPMMFLQAEAEEDSFGGPDYCRSRDFFLSTFESTEMTRLGTHAPLSLNAMGLDDNPSGVVRRAHVCVSREAVDVWCKCHHARPHAFLMTVYNIVLAKLCRTTHLAYATLIHGRTDRRLHDAYGMFVKTVPVVCDVLSTDLVGDAVADVQRRLFSAIRHNAYPFTHFCHDMQAAPGISFSFQGGNILEQVPLEYYTAEGMQLERDGMDGELSCVVYCKDIAYEIRTEAICDGASTDWAGLVAQAMKNGVEYILTHPDTCVGDVDIVSVEEKKSLISLSQGEPMAVDDAATWVDDFLRMVAATPDALAVSDGTTSLTYRELDNKSMKVATALLRESVGSGDLVGVEATPCSDFLVAVIGVMRSGAAYVPLDPQWPAAHRHTVIKEARLKKKITTDTLTTLDTDTRDADTIDTLPHPDDAAYVIFTSGTTGRPKGVVIPHRALHHLAQFIAMRWQLSASSRISCHSSLAFDGSVEDLFPVLTVGGTVYIMPEHVRRNPAALHRFIEQYQITGGCYTTAMAPLLDAEPHPSLNYLCLGGEKLRHHPQMHCHVYNTYGPTEFTVDATYYELSAEDDPDIPIGRPLANCAAYVTDPFGMLLPRGAVGELCLGGPQMALGYLNDRVLTAEKFTGCLFTEGTIYHTGDMVRWDEQGLLHYVGRRDRQVKVNGFRIAMDEVERQIASLDSVRQVAVKCQKMGTHEVLCAFFTADRALSSEQMKSALRNKCPAYMIPVVFVQMEQLPLTPGGKVDYRQLSVPNPIQKEKHDHQKPENEQERLFCRIFAKVLERKDFGATDDFFQFGGTSILVMRVMVEAEKAGVQIRYGDVFRYPTPQLLASKINDDTRDRNHVVEDYDYSPLHRFLGNRSDRRNRSTPNNPNIPNNPSIPSIPRNILLTGATGFLGAHVLWQLLKEGDCCGCETPDENHGCSTSHPNIICVVRAASEAEGWERLEETWRYYFELPIADKSRIEVMAGDLTDNNFWKLLESKEVDLVVNCAADVRHFAQRNALSEVNTQAVCRLADFCMAHHARLVHVSTLSVAGFSASRKPLALTDQELYVGQQFLEQYSLSKFLAERELLERMAYHGLNALIVRIGNLTARQSDGRFQRNPEHNAFAMAMRMLTEQNILPQSAVDLPVDISPVDVVAKELTELVCKDSSVGVIHLAHPHKGGLPDLLQRLTGRPPR